MYQQPRFLLAGDQALCVELGDAISPEVTLKIRGLVAAVEKAAVPGIADLIPSYRSILVYYDPLTIPLADLKDRLTTLSRGAGEERSGSEKVVELPTIYGGEYGPDLYYVAGHNHLSLQEVIDIHSGTKYLVHMLGFSPGFPYLGGMSERIATPRLETPRLNVPAGSVSIAENQTGVYPLESPGGWRLIGRTPVRLFDSRSDPPVIMESWGYVSFKPIDQATYQQIQQQVEAASYQVKTWPAS